MFDLTLNQEDKDTYIVDAVMNDDSTYTVKFASGREETYPFSIHNFQVELYRMEEQFEKYGKDYLEKIYPNGGMRSFLLGVMIAADIAYVKVIFDEGLNFTRGWLLGYALYMLLPRLIPHIKSRKLYKEAKKKIALMKLYFENKEQFKVEVVNPNNGSSEDWYLVNLANIDSFETEKDFNNYLQSLTREEKQHQADEMSLRLLNTKGGINI